MQPYRCRFDLNLSTRPFKVDDDLRCGATGRDMFAFTATPLDGRLSKVIDVLVSLHGTWTKYT